MTGWFEGGHPFVNGAVVLPRLNLCGEVLFKVDTGADVSVLSPHDAARLGLVPLDQPVARTAVLGGHRVILLEDALLAFGDEQLKVYGCTIGILEQPEAYGLPSVLGRDILERWRITMEPSSGLFQIDLLHPDWDGARSNRDIIRSCG